MKLLICQTAGITIFGSTFRQLSKTNKNITTLLTLLYLEQGVFHLPSYMFGVLQVASYLWPLTARHLVVADVTLEKLLFNALSGVFVGGEKGKLLKSFLVFHPKIQHPVNLSVDRSDH